MLKTKSYSGTDVSNDIVKLNEHIEGGTLEEDTDSRKPFYASHKFDAPRSEMVIGESVLDQESDIG